MSERENDGERSRKRSRNRDRERHSDRDAHDRKRSRDTKPRNRSRRSRSPDTRKHSRHRHGDEHRERHGRHKSHKRHSDDRDRRRRSRSPSASSVSSAAPSVDRASHSAHPPPPFPSAASLDTARSILTSLVTLDPASHDDLLFLLFQLDHHHSIVVQHVAHPEARQQLQRLLHVLGLQRTTEEDGEEGWRRWEEWGERKLLAELESGLNVGSKGQQKRDSEVEQKSAESVVAAEVHESIQAVHPAAVIGPALPPPSYRPPSIEQQQQSPSQTDQREEEEEDESGYGPRLASQLTADERAALDELQQARQRLTDTRQHIQHLRSTATASTAAPLAHEEWMTVVPAAMSGQAALMASMTGDRAMKGRSFALRGGGSGGDRDSSGWAAGPEEREWRRMEREAERAVEKALTHLRGLQHRLHNKPADSTTPSSVASTVRTSIAATSSAVSAEPSLLELHQQRLKAEQSNAVRERGAPIFWDRDKEMGMRRHKTDKQIVGEMRGATELNSRFAMGT